MFLKLTHAREGLPLYVHSSAITVVEARVPPATGSWLVLMTDGCSQSIGVNESPDEVMAKIKDYEHKLYGGA